MQVIPTRAHAMRALESRRNQLLVEDRPDEAAQVERDRRLISRTPGQDLDQMLRLAQDQARRLEGSALARDARSGWPVGPIGLMLGLGGAAIGGTVGWALDAVVHAPVEVSLPLGLVLIVGGIGCAFIPEYFHGQAERASATVAAIDRNFGLIESYQPEGSRGQLPMADFLRLGRQRESELLAGGQPLRAGNLRHVCQQLQSLDCPTLEQGLDEVFRRAHDGPDARGWGQTLSIIQDSPDVLGLVRSMLEVDRLADGLQATGSSLEVRPDAVRIGSVLLRPRQAVTGASLLSTR